MFLCLACGCHANSSVSTVCNIITGQCDCKANVIGDKCDRCQVCVGSSGTRLFLFLLINYLFTLSKY